MSDPIQDVFIRESGRPLIVSGQLWIDRLSEEQVPLVHQMVSIVNRLQQATELDAVGSYVAATPQVSVMYPWHFKPSDLQVQGPPSWGFDPETGWPSQDAPVITDVSKPRAYLTTDGRVIETRTGDPDSIPFALELHEQTVWFLPRPADYRPILLISETATLVEGQGFLCVGDWLVLFSNPMELWPDRVIVSMSCRRLRCWKSSALRTDNLYTNGKHIARYRRNSQNLKFFERALMEVAGLPVLEEDGVIVRIETAGNQSIHWLDDGRSFTLAGASPYAEAQFLPAYAGHRLQLRCPGLQGSNWWANRYWGAAGIPIFIFSPGFTGFAIPDDMLTVVTSDEDGSLRSRIIFDQDENAENAYWEWLNAQESRAGTEIFATSVIGATEAGVTLKNALQVFAEISDTWFGVVETSLDVHDPWAFQRLRDFIERERPAGMQVYCAGQSEAFTDPDAFQAYVSTGTLQGLDTNYRVVRATPY